MNAKRVYRLYREEGLSLRYKRAKKRVSVSRVTPPPATRPNERWSIDFLKDSLADGRPFRVLTVVDNVSRVNSSLWGSTVHRFVGSKKAFAVIRTLQRRHRASRNVPCLASIRRRRPESTNYR